jgi:hypothetical protein
VPSLKADADRVKGSVRRRVSLRDALVVTQLALSLVLLVAGALLARGLLVRARHRPRIRPRLPSPTSTSTCR